MNEKGWASVRSPVVMGNNLFGTSIIIRIDEPTMFTTLTIMIRRRRKSYLFFFFFCFVFKGSERRHGDSNEGCTINDDTLPVTLSKGCRMLNDEDNKGDRGGGGYRH